MGWSRVFSALAGFRLFSVDCATLVLRQFCLHRTADLNDFSLRRFQKKKIIRCGFQQTKGPRRSVPEGSRCVFCCHIAWQLCHPSGCALCTLKSPWISTEEHDEHPICVGLHSPSTKAAALLPSVQMLGAVQPRPIPVRSGSEPTLKMVHTRHVRVAATILGQRRCQPQFQHSRSGVLVPFGSSCWEYKQHH